MRAWMRVDDIPAVHGGRHVPVGQVVLTKQNGELGSRLGEAPSKLGS